MAQQDEHDSGDAPKCEQPICPTCGPARIVRVQSHDQCARCGRVLESCCDGGER